MVTAHSDQYGDLHPSGTEEPRRRHHQGEGDEGVALERIRDWTRRRHGHHGHREQPVGDRQLPEHHDQQPHGDHHPGQVEVGPDVMAP